MYHWIMPWWIMQEEGQRLERTAMGQVRPN